MQNTLNLKIKDHEMEAVNKHSLNPSELYLSDK